MHGQNAAVICALSAAISASTTTRNATALDGIGDIVLCSAFSLALPALANDSDDTSRGLLETNGANAEHHTRTRTNHTPTHDGSRSITLQRSSLTVRRLLGSSLRH